MGALRATGRADDVALTLEGRKQQAVLSATIFRQESATCYLMRLQPIAAGASGIVISRAQAGVMNVIRDMPEPFVVTDLDRRIVSANAAFLDSAQLGSEEQAQGRADRPLAGPCGRRCFRSFQQPGRKGRGAPVPDHAARPVRRGGGCGGLRRRLAAGNPTCYGFSIRRVNRRALEAEPGKRSLLRSVEEMTKLVGKVPLKDLVREATDIIERLCIEAALQLNDNNRASTADMLGLSRQSLYVKLHRYGIEDKDGGGEGQRPREINFQLVMPAKAGIPLFVVAHVDKKRDASFRWVTERKVLALPSGHRQSLVSRSDVLFPVGRGVFA